MDLYQVRRDLEKTEIIIKNTIKELKNLHDTGAWVQAGSLNVALDLLDDAQKNLD